jgi:transcription-repair coupling factor (superfamily II helicase)
VEIYRKLSDAKSTEEVKNVEAEIQDRFGSLSPEVEDLLNITCIRIMASRLGIHRVSMKKENLSLEFSPDRKIGKNQIEHLHKHIGLPVEFVANGTLKILIGLNNVGEKRSLFVKNLLQRL